MFLSHAQHHKHSYYVIRGTDRLAGFNDDEVERIALVARYHRKSEPTPEAPRVRRARRRRQARGRACSRGCCGSPSASTATTPPGCRSLSVEDKGDRLVVKATPVPGEDIGLELYAASTRAGLLESTLDLSVDVREA